MGQGKRGCRSAGVEPDNLAGVTGFAIPPQIWYDVFFLYDTFIFI